MIRDNTPIEVHQCSGIPVLVKREDLCCPFPGPSFSKIRGVVAHIKKRPEQTIGVLDTFHSKAGWAVAYVCAHLGKDAIDYWPVYKGDDPNDLRHQQLMVREFNGATMRLKAGRSAILYHRAKKDLKETDPNGYMMPNALKLDESVIENCAEAERTFDQLGKIGTLVISISSGTVAAGIVKGLMESGRSNTDVVLHMGYSRSAGAVESYMDAKIGRRMPKSVRLVDEGYDYAEPAVGAAPFPCNKHYDLKAWNWLRAGAVRQLKTPILFWNIGD